MITDNPIGIYIHVPFCVSKCPYCDFYSVADRTKIDGYVSAVTDELDDLIRMGEFVEADVKKRPVDTVYFGGGTPSYMGKDGIIKILDAVRRNFSVRDDAEITVECNPSSPGLSDFLSAVAKNGVNRISLGMQSAVDIERKKLGRKADADTVKRAVADCKAAGIDNISVDIMLGIPLQTKESLAYSLDTAVNMGISHISAYMLKIEEGTFFYKKRNEIAFPDEDETADMYSFMCSYLASKGMRHYEISNFCFDDKYSRHNTKYWQSAEYLGFGPAAHSFYNKKRFYFDRSLEGFIKGEKAIYDGEGGEAEEYIMLALRLDTGISLEDIKEKFGIMPKNGFFPIVKELEKHGLVRFDGDRLSLTEEGFLVSNAVIIKIIEEFI